MRAGINTLEGESSPDDGKRGKPEYTIWHDEEDDSGNEYLQFMNQSNFTATQLKSVYISSDNKELKDNIALEVLSDEISKHTDTLPIGFSPLNSGFLGGSKEKVGE